jgi:hypothetical protein
MEKASDGRFPRNNRKNERPRLASTTTKVSAWAHSSPPRSGLQFGHLHKITSEDFAPKGLEDSAQGFNPVSTLGTNHQQRALRGRQIERASNVEVGSNCGTSQSHTDLRAIGARFTQSSLAPSASPTRRTGCHSWNAHSCAF